MLQLQTVAPGILELLKTSHLGPVSKNRASPLTTLSVPFWTWTDLRIAKISDSRSHIYYYIFDIIINIKKPAVYPQLVILP